MLDENHVVDVADQAYLTDMNIYFKEDDLWVLATQHVERWSYSDTGLTPEEAEESVLLVCAGLSSTLTISQLITESDNLIDTVFRAFSIWQSLLNIGFLRQALKTTADNISFSYISTSTQRLCCVHTSLIWTIFFLVSRWYYCWRCCDKDHLNARRFPQSSSCKQHRTKREVTHSGRLERTLAVDLHCEVLFFSVVISS